MVYARRGNGHLVAICPPEYADNQADNARLIAAAPELLESCKLLLAGIAAGSIGVSCFGGSDASRPDPVEMISAAVDRCSL